MKNPFVYGEIVPSSAFVDRVEELERLVRDLGASQKVFLISPRRYGKSSLIAQALGALGRHGAIVVNVSVASYSSYLAFLEGYARALVRAETRPDRARDWLRAAIDTVAPQVRLAADDPRLGRLSVSFPGVRSAQEVSRLAVEVFNLPQKLGELHHRQVVVALDEFQAIAGFDGESVEHALRDAVQGQRRVGYVFAGSEPSLIERMLGPRRPFYKAGPVVRLGTIPPRLFADFVESRFTRSGMKPEPGLGDGIVELAGGLPYDVQRLAHELWDDAKAAARRRVGLDELHVTLVRLLGEQEPLFEALWQRLTLAQRSTLRAVVLDEGRELLSADARLRHRLPGPSSVQAALAALRRHDIILREEDRYLVVDSLLREWVARRTF
jgi:hypothetical protein